jgi:regulator of sirC expression with transglutaminase-like and TPR domain
MDQGLRAFSDAVRRPDAEIDLAHAALEIARVEHADLAPARHLARLDVLAARSGAAHIDDPLRALHRLREFLFEEEGFVGNAREYYDPRNSCLNDVLDRKLGIPITLSVLMMAVGHRVGLPIAGVGLPGHFVVRADVGTEPMLLDPFDAGALLTHERAADLVARALGRPIALTAEHLAPVTRTQVLVRMLTNLKGIYASGRQWSKALDVLERLLILDERSAVHVRDRGTVLVRLGHLHRGASDWERYLRACPAAADADTVKQQLHHARQRLGALN